MKPPAAPLLVTALALTAVAQPHGHAHHHPARAAHQHNHQHLDSRAQLEVDVVWVTVTITTCIDGATTAPPSYPTPSSPSTPATTMVTVTSKPGQVFEGLPSDPPPVLSPLPDIIVPSYPEVKPAPIVATSIPAPYVPPAAPYVSPAAPYVSPAAPYVPPAAYEPPQSEPPKEIATPAPVEIPAPAPAPVEVPSKVAAPAQPINTSPVINTSPGSGSGSGISGVESVLGSGFSSGDLTYYDVGLGACGTDNSGEDMTANIVAMSADTMGAQSNGNPICGKRIKVFNSVNGKTSIGTIRDKCPGCAAGSIDVSRKMFQELAELSQGRLKISWNWA